MGAELFLVLGPLAKARGLLPRYDPTGVFRPGVDDDWRVPDQVYAEPDVASARGVEGAASLVVEILSPHDETYAKLDWYASVGVHEVLVIDPETRRVELFANRGGHREPVEPVPSRPSTSAPTPWTACCASPGTEARPTSEWSGPSIGWRWPS